MALLDNETVVDLQSDEGTDPNQPLIPSSRCSSNIKKLISAASLFSCAFLSLLEKGSCHKLSDKFGKLRFKATKKSQCKTVASLLEKEKETKIVLEATRPDEATQSTNDAVPVLQSPNSGGDGIESIQMRTNGNAPTINNETIVMQLFQYRENQLTSIYYDCSKENRLLKRVENTLCTSFRLLERAHQQNWIVNADIVGVEYNIPICSFLKAEKLYCKNSP
ncbi:hypothetical protein Ocin01_19275 [Orchesella cincta]|uniref:Uncharacterized protein n=1 Tax=Orchesella cincta TaxID=48709 RepID=A0A1D2M358_ORCCI|nr:hypothetical protein Ocin01_19275 [Orchesella cincta]